MFSEMSDNSREAVMDFSPLEAALGVIATGCGFGAFVDFYIGKKGQEQVKKWLEIWWIKISYVTWENFGKKEAEFVVKIAEITLGISLYSLKRIYSTLLIGLFCLFFSIVISILIHNEDNKMYDKFNEILFFPLHFFISCLFLAVSISITLIIARKIANIPYNSKFANFTFFLFLTFIQYIIITTWASTSSLFQIITIMLPISALDEGYINLYDYIISYYIIIRSAFQQIFLENLKLIFKPRSIVVRNINNFYGTQSTFIENVEMTFMLFMSFVPNCARLIASLFFTIMFALQPVKNQIMVLWARIIESDKPVFTLLGGGIAVIIKGIQEITKTL